MERELESCHVVVSTTRGRSCLCACVCTEDPGVCVRGGGGGKPPRVLITRCGGLHRLLIEPADWHHRSSERAPSTGQSVVRSTCLLNPHSSSPCHYGGTRVSECRSLSPFSCRYRQTLVYTCTTTGLGGTSLYRRRHVSRLSNVSTEKFLRGCASPALLSFWLGAVYVFACVLIS